MSRTPLANRRRHVSFDVRHGEHTFVVGMGEFDASGAQPGMGGGSPAEVFVHCSAKHNTSAMQDTVRDAAILVSMALQHGCSLETIGKALTQDHRGGPASVIGAVVERMREVATAAEAAA